MLWPTASELLQQLQTEPSFVRAVRIEQVRWLGRYGLEEELEKQHRLLRASRHWDAALALELSLAWLLTGQAQQADLAFLEADDLDPTLDLVPDFWGLWPVPPAAPERVVSAEQRAVEQELAEEIRHWRRMEAASLDAAWRLRALSDWTEALNGPALDELVLLLRHDHALEPSIETFLANLVGESEIESSPGQAFRFWGVLTDIRPDWVHARIKATDLALATGNLEHCASWLTTASAEIRSNVWICDIAARYAIATGAIQRAMDHWGRALAAATPELAEVFRQRRRDARRGPGVLQARSLLNRGDMHGAMALLQRLVAEDPEWQPLRTLLLQAESHARQDAGTHDAVGEGQAPLRFNRFLEWAATRSGIALPPATLVDQDAEHDLANCRQTLEGFSRCLRDAEARFALES